MTLILNRLSQTEQVRLRKCTVQLLFINGGEAVMLFGWIIIGGAISSIERNKMLNAM